MRQLRDVCGLLFCLLDEITGRTCHGRFVRSEGSLKVLLGRCEYNERSEESSRTCKSFNNLFVSLVACLSFGASHRKAISSDMLPAVLRL